MLIKKKKNIKKNYQFIIETPLTNKRNPCIKQKIDIIIANGGHEIPLDNFISPSE